MLINAFSGKKSLQNDGMWSTTKASLNLYNICQTIQNTFV